MSDIIFDNLVFDRLREIGDQSQRLGELEREIARLRLTDAEREAVAWAAAIEPEPSGRWTKTNEAAWNQRSATLRALLERLG